jgi:anti-sigma factor RsiW
MPLAVPGEASPQVTAAVDPVTVAELSPAEGVPAAALPEAPSEPTEAPRPVRSWPVLLLALPAFVAVWSGWVGLGTLTGFGVVHPLPGIADGFTINSAITLPIGVETYAAFALRVWLSGQVPASARRFAKWSALSALVLGALGQVAYHLLEAAGVTRAPWQITTVVACLPVAVLGMGAALAHLIHARPTQNGSN